MVWVEALVPFDKGELLSTVHQVGMVEQTVSIHSDCVLSMIRKSLISQSWKLEYE